MSSSVSTSNGVTSSLREAPWAKIAGLWALSRLLIVGMGWLGWLAVAKGAYVGPSRRFWDFVMRWDGNWYWSIAVHGYKYEEGVTSSVAFFPGYPLLMRLLNPLFPDAPYSGVLISNLSLLAAGGLLWLLVRDQERGQPDAPDRADLAVAFLFFGPVSLFFSPVYTESLYLLCCLGAFSFAVRGRFLLAGLCGTYAGLTRNAGALLVLPLLWEYWHAKGRPTGWRGLFGAVPCFLPGLGPALFFGYLWWEFGDPGVFSRAQLQWQRFLNWPWVPFEPSRLKQFAPFYQYWFIGAASLGLVALVVAFFVGVRRSVWLFGALSLIFALSANHLESIPRYLSVVLPLYFLVARRPASWAMWSWVAVAFSATLLGLSTILFVNGYWFT